MDSNEIAALVPVEYLREAKAGLRRSLRDELVRRLEFIKLFHPTWTAVARSLGIEYRVLRSYLGRREGVHYSWPQRATADRIDLAYWSCLDRIKRYAKSNNACARDPDGGGPKDVAK